MTDVTLLPSAAGTRSAADARAEAIARRLRARHRAEARFKAYGIAAVLFAATFLVFLLGDILIKGVPAFIEHRLALEIAVPADLAPEGRRDAETLRGADYNASVRASLLALFPEVQGRGPRNRLADLLSSAASDSLRERVVADPVLIGRRVSVPLLMSDEADQYLKGTITGRATRRGTGLARVSGTSGEVTLEAPGRDFAERLSAIKRAVSAQARTQRLEAARLRRLLGGLSGSETAALQARIDEIEAGAAALQRRADEGAAPETLDAGIPSELVAINGGLVKLDRIEADRASGTMLLPLAQAGEAAPGTWSTITIETPEANRKLTDQQIAWLDRLNERGMVERGFAARFLTSGDSREPEVAGVLGGLTGSALTMLVTLLLCLPIGVGAAVYLEEFALKNRLTDLIEVNINNLAAVPSIVFGLLGLAVFLNWFGLPRSSPLVGGLVLALLVLPTIIIASRAALRSVPPSIREAALGIGASQQQAVFHHVLPLAMPGILTGTIIGMAHALGETAPLLLIGMVAFIVDVPGSVTESATVLPVQIYLWSDLPEAAFQSKTAGAIIVLLLFLFVMNGLAVILRRRFERQW